jgi:predicted transcriptional regulator
MRLQEVMTVTQAQLFSPDPAEPGSQSILGREVRTGFGADLMSDVLRYNVAQGLLITGLVNPQIVRTAEMADVAAILMARGNKPLPETIEIAQQVDIPIIGTQLTLFESCGRLYAAGLKAAPRQDEEV